MVGIINIGPQGSGRYQIPDYSGYAQGGAALGQGIAQGLGAIGQGMQRRRDRDELAGFTNTLWGQGLDAAMQAHPGAASNPAFMDVASLWASQNQPSEKADDKWLNLYDPASNTQRQVIEGSDEHRELAAGGWLLGNAASPSSASDAERTKTKAADGYWYWDDTQERVFPNVDLPPDTPELTVLQKNLIASGLEYGTPEFQEALKQHMTESPRTELGTAIARMEELRAIPEGERTPAQQKELNAIEMSVMFGGRAPPEGYVKARSSLQQARDAMNGLWQSLTGGRGAWDALSPEKRAEAGQFFSSLKLAFADLLNRGANFTDTEQALIEDTIGGNPADLWNRFVSGDENYLSRLQTTATIIESRSAGLIASYTIPGLKDHSYPWEQSPAGNMAPESPSVGGVVESALDTVSGVAAGDSPPAIPPAPETATPPQVQTAPPATPETPAAATPPVPETPTFDPVAFADQVQNMSIEEFDRITADLTTKQAEALRAELLRRANGQTAQPQAAPPQEQDWLSGLWNSVF